MAINLHEKYASNIVKAHTKESFLKGKAKAPYDFTGVKTVMIPNIITQPLNDYNRTGSSNRYGTPSEIQDALQELTMAKDRSFSLTIDKGNNTEQQNMKKAGEVMQMQIREQVTPETDKYTLGKWAKNAGKTLAYSGAVTKSNIISMILDIETELNNSLTPESDRYLCVKNTHVKFIRTSDEFQYVDKGADMILKGVVGSIGTLKLIAMPDAWFPAHVQHVAFHSRAVLAPMKINDTKLHIDPPGISGHLLEGRFIYDAFVVGGVCDDVIVAVDASYKTATPTATKGSTTTTLASTTNSGTVNIYYTVDGTDPRYSTTRELYSAAITNLAAGGVIKAVAEYVDRGSYYVSDMMVYTF